MPDHDQQIADWVADNLADAEHSEARAAELPPGREKDEHLDYAAECRANAARPNTTLLHALRGTFSFPEQSLALRLGAAAEETPTTQSAAE